MIFRVRCRTSQEAEVAGSREIWHVGRGVTRVMLSYTTPMQCSAMPFHWKPKFACLAKLFKTNMESFEESRDTCKCYNSRDTCHDECDESHAGRVVTGFSRANMSRPAPASLVIRDTRLVFIRYTEQRLAYLRSCKLYIPWPRLKISILTVIQTLGLCIRN